VLQDLLALSVALCALVIMLCGFTAMVLHDPWLVPRTIGRLTKKGLMKLLRGSANFFTDISERIWKYAGRKPLPVMLPLRLIAATFATVGLLLWIPTEIIEAIVKAK
jgi:hypothetical protein